MANMQNQSARPVNKYKDFFHNFSMAASQEGEGTKYDLATLTPSKLQEINLVGVNRGFFPYFIIFFFISIFAVFSKQYGSPLEFYIIPFLIIFFEYMFKIRTLTPKSRYSNKMYRHYIAPLIGSFFVFSTAIPIGVYYLVMALKANNHIMKIIAYQFYEPRKYHFFNYQNFAKIFLNNNYRIWTAGEIVSAPAITAAALLLLYKTNTKIKEKNKPAAKGGAAEIDPEIAGGYIHAARFDVFNTLITGSTGSGKTQLLYRIILDRQRYKMRSVFFDTKGDYLQTFYRPDKDILWDITDARSVLWNFLEEAEDKAQLKQFAYYLFEDIPGDNNPFFRSAAREMLFSKLLDIWTANETGNADFVKKISDVNAADVEKQNPDVIKTYKDQIANLQFINTTGQEFSLKEWLRNPEDRRNIFIGVNLEYIDIQRPFFRIFLSIINAMITGKSWTNTERIHIYIDEFGNVGEIDNIDTALSLCREQKVGYFLSTQSLINIHALYRDKFNNIIENCNNTYNFKTKDTASAKIIAESYGQEDEKQMLTSQGTNPEISQNTSMSENLRKKYVVEIKDLNGLSPLQYFAKILILAGADVIDKTIKLHTLRYLPLKKDLGIPKFIRRKDWSKEAQQALDAIKRQEPQGEEIAKEKVTQETKFEREF